MAEKLKLFSKKFFARLLQLLGITPLLTAFGCAKPMYGVIRSPAVCMYGVPGNFFTLEGTVVDEDEKPVPGIQLKVKTDDEEEKSSVHPYEQSFYSDADGKYALTWNDYDSGNLKFVIDAQDIDGEENGAFTDKSFDVEFTDKPYDKTNFGNRKYKKDGFTLKLSKKESE